MTHPPSDPSGPPSPTGIRKLTSTIVWWIDPEENPTGLVYGTIAVGAVLATESSRRETFAATVAATVVILALYWLAHAYATATGHRLQTRQTLSARSLWRSL
ncbi:MAG: hypothetical protein ACRDY1_05510, partial [Acidimicrobiales bacterium]